MNIPDTILFKYDQPFLWYFVKDKHLKRKSKSKLNTQEIEKKFLSHKPKSGIVASFISQYSLSTNQEKVIFEYMNADELSF